MVNADDPTGGSGETESMSNTELAKTFLSSTGERLAGIPLVNPSSPVDWGKLAKTLFGAFISLVFAGYYQILNGLANLVATPWRGLGSFGASVFETLQTGGEELFTTIASAASESLVDFGFAGIRVPIAIAVILSGFAIVAYGVQEVRS